MSPPADDWVAIQRNPWSGSGRGRRELLHLIKSLKRGGLVPRLFSRREELDSAVRAARDAGRLRGIVAAGGDGTLLDVVNRHPDVPVAVLPLGTENLFARAWGIPCSGATVAELVLGGGAQTIDAAVCNGRRFLVVASAGFDAEVIRLAHLQRRGRIRRWFYLAPIARALRGYSFPRLEVRLDDAPPVEGRLVIVSNLPAYALRLNLTPHATGDDGWLDVCIFQRPGPLAVCSDLAAVLAGRHHLGRHVVTGRARRLRIEGLQAPVQLDGDAAGKTPVDIAVQPGAVRVFLPERAAAAKRLPGQDSNLDEQDQNLLCYRYTTG